MPVPDKGPSAALANPLPASALDIPHAHYEKWDGMDYSRWLQSKHIPYVARIFAVVHVQAALRPALHNRKRRTDEKAREHIRTSASPHSDSTVLAVF